MPKKWFLVLLLMITTVIVIAACAQSTESPEVTSPETVDAEALINEKCSTCHSANLVFNNDYDRQGWEDVFDDMINRGADVTEDEKALMIDWLLDN